VSNGGTFTLAALACMKALAASAIAITVVGNAARNMAFARSAIALATRVPALPKQGDMAADRMIITDPISGLSFEVACTSSTARSSTRSRLAWGVKAA
jgi:hypothetical protein